MFNAHKKKAAKHKSQISPVSGDKLPKEPSVFKKTHKKTHKKNWIAGAIKHPGALKRSLGVKEGNKIPATKLHAAAKKGGVTGQRARLAETLKSFHKTEHHKMHVHHLKMHKHHMKMAEHHKHDAVMHKHHKTMAEHHHKSAMHHKKMGNC